jgi:hypothetical protein
MNESSRCRKIGISGFATAPRRTVARYSATNSHPRALERAGGRRRALRELCPGEAGPGLLLHAPADDRGSAGLLIGPAVEVFGRHPTRPDAARALTRDAPGIEEKTFERLHPSLTLTARGTA